MHRIPNLHIPMADKIAHASFYGVLCGLFFRAFVLQEKFAKLRQYALCTAMVFTILYGITDEIHQLFVWGRTSDILDVTSDAIGGLHFVVPFILYQQYGQGTTVRAAQDVEV